MSLIKCPECGKEISDKSDKCIHCGYPINPPTTNSSGNNNKSSNKAIGILACALTIAVIAIVVLLVSRFKTKADREICKVDGCEEDVYSNDLCIDHYVEQREEKDVANADSSETSSEDESSGKWLDNVKDDADATAEASIAEETTTSDSKSKDDSDNVAEEKDKTTPFSQNATVATESCEFTMTGYDIAGTIEPKNCTSSYYHYFEASSGNVYVDVTFNIKNLRNKAVDQSAVVSSVTLIYDDQYEYRCSFVTVDKDGDFENYTNLYSINALETIEYHMLAEVPTEIKDSDKSLKIQVVVDGETYECVLR